MKHIVLIDFTLEGHHLSFVRTFSEILLRQGHQVYCVVPLFECVEKHIGENVPDKRSFFKGYDYTTKPKKYSVAKKVDETLETLNRWKQDALIIKKIEKDNQIKTDLVFYAWLDYHFAQFVPGFLLDLIFPFKWTGLYFHPYHLRQNNVFIKRKLNWRDFDSIFLAKNCIGVAVHDIAIVQQFSKRIRKPVVHFPETADDTRPDYDNQFYVAIKQRARGRIVLGMIGCERHKGTITMMKLAKAADVNQYFFAFLGRLPEKTYSKDEWSYVRSFIEEKRENCYFHFDQIPEGAIYNAVFCAFDIPFLIYDHFISSSNRLTKASIFRKLVLASDNFCVGDDVRTYNLGEAVKPCDADSAMAGLEKLRAKIINKQLPEKEWSVYASLNSNTKLYQRFEQIINLTDHKN